MQAERHGDPQRRGRAIETMNHATASRRLLLIRLLLFAILAAACFARLGSNSLYETDEGFAATRADSFYRHHTWRLSFDDVGEDGPQFRKPPLLYWCVAGLFKLIGPTMWAVRLPTALAGFLCAFLAWRLARRFVGESASLAASLLLVTIPFVLLHIRTAMLEMPLVCLALAGTCGFAFLQSRAWRIATAGLAAGAAILLKGDAGAYVLVVPLAFGLIYRRLHPSALLELPLVAITAAILPLAYLAAVPSEFRGTMVHRLFVDEASQRIRLFQSVLGRIPSALEVLNNTLAWHMPAAAGGFLLLASGIRRHNAWERTAFLLLVVLATLPLLWVYASMVHPFPRYLLPAYPFLLILSATFALQVLTRRGAALWLIAFSIATACLGPSPLRWIPAGVSAVMALLSLRTASSSPVWRHSLSWCLLAAIALPSALTPSAHLYHPGPDRGPRPELVPLARQLQDLVPENTKVIVEERIKCHTILFYGRRAIEPLGSWLLTTARPGEFRYGIFQHLPPELPGFTTKVMETSDSWHLVKLTINNSPLPWGGILLVKSAEKDMIGLMLDQMGVEKQVFDKGFVLHRIPTNAALRAQPAIRITSTADDRATPFSGTRPLLVPGGATLLLAFDKPVPCGGLDLIPSDRRQPMEGWKVEYRGEPTGEWALLRVVENPFASHFTFKGQRLEKTMKRGLRLRFPAIMAREWRISRTDPSSVSLDEVTCYDGG